MPAECSDLERFGLPCDFEPSSVVARFSLPGEPMSKARARTTRTGTYSPAANRKAEQAIGWAFRKAAAPYEKDPQSEFGLAAIFVSSTRQRRDVDNMLKLLLDGLNGVAWGDDAQVSEVIGRKELRWDSAEAITEVLVYRTSAGNLRTRDCEHCGATFRMYRSWMTRRFCSAACDSARRAATRERACGHCGKEFDHPKQTYVAKYCSRECDNAAKRVTLQCAHCGIEYTRARSLSKKAVAACSRACRAVLAREQGVADPKAICADCQGPLSKKGYTRCRACILGAVPITHTTD